MLADENQPPGVDGSSFPTHNRAKPKKNQKSQHARKREGAEEGRARCQMRVSALASSTAAKTSSPAPDTKPVTALGVTVERR